MAQGIPYGTPFRQAYTAAPCKEKAAPLLAPKLIRYVGDGKVAIDTNLAERAIRPFALGPAVADSSPTPSAARVPPPTCTIWFRPRGANDLELYADLCRLFAELAAARAVEQVTV